MAKRKGKVKGHYRKTKRGRKWVKPHIREMKKKNRGAKLQTKNLTFDEIIALASARLDKLK